MPSSALSTTTTRRGSRADDCQRDAYAGGVLDRAAACRPPVPVTVNAPAPVLLSTMPLAAPFDAITLRKVRPLAPMVVLATLSAVPVVVASVFVDPVTLTVPPPVALKRCSRGAGGDAAGEVERRAAVGVQVDAGAGVGDRAAEGDRAADVR